jgi:hypothetical protein
VACEHRAEGAGNAREQLTGAQSSAAETRSMSGNLCAATWLRDQLNEHSAHHAVLRHEPLASSIRLLRGKSHP